MVIVCWLGFTNAQADEKASKNVLDKGIIFYGGIQVYQADGQFSYVKDNDPNVEVGLDDIGKAYADCFPGSVLLAQPSKERRTYCR